jgi:3-deoxy-D-manno-octulosonic acid (KDO) 8-phosphate synthase
MWLWWWSQSHHEKKTILSFKMTIFVDESIFLCVRGTSEGFNALVSVEGET